jgi:MFS family permease
MLLTGVLALFDYETSGWIIAASMFIRGLFFGFFFIPLQAASFATISPEAMGRASSLFSVTRQVAASLGVAILATALTNRLGAHDAVLADPATREAALAAFQDTFLFAAALSVLGILACFVIDDDKASQAIGAEVVGEASSPSLEPSFEETAAG